MRVTESSIREEVVDREDCSHQQTLAVSMKARQLRYDSEIAVVLTS